MIHIILPRIHYWCLSISATVPPRLVSQNRMYRCQISVAKREQIASRLLHITCHLDVYKGVKRNEDHWALDGLQAVCTIHSERHHRNHSQVKVVVRGPDNQLSGPMSHTVSLSQNKVPVSDCLLPYFLKRGPLIHCILFIVATQVIAKLPSSVAFIPLQHDLLQ
jgi:hypothetical protein